jgi:hypothetical protein
VHANIDQEILNFVLLSRAERNSGRYEHARARHARHTTQSFTAIFEYSFYMSFYYTQEKLFLKHTTRASPARVTDKKNPTAFTTIIFQPYLEVCCTTKFSIN